VGPLDGGGGVAGEGMVSEGRLEPSVSDGDSGEKKKGKKKGVVLKDSRMNGGEKLGC